MPTANAQTCTHTLTGQVVEYATRQPLPGATITLDGTSQGTLADADGSFRLEHLCTQTYQLSIGYLGYTSKRITVVVGPDLVQALAPIYLYPDSHTLHEVNVVDHRSEAQHLLQVQTQLSGQALDAMRGLTLGESLKNMTGLYVIQTGPSIAKPVIHGLYSNRILTLNNGVRQEDQQWGSEHAPQIDPFVADRITVIKGAASIRYGSDAVGGVILVEPRALPTQPGIAAELNAVGGTNGRQGTVSGMVEGAFGKKLKGLSWRLQGTLKRIGFTKTPTYYLDNTSYREANGSADVHYVGERAGIEAYYSRFSANVGLFTGAQVGNLDDFYAALARPQPLQQPGFAYTLQRPFQQVGHDLLKISGYWQLPNSGRLTATVARQQNNRQEYDYLSFSQTTKPELSLRLVTHSADLVWEHKPSRTASGGQWSGNTGLTFLTQSNVREYLFLIPNYRNYAAGLFTIERYARNAWTWEAGLRYDYRWLRAYFLNENTKRVYSDTRNWRNLTGSLGATWQATPVLSMAANLSTAWRAPNVSELYSDGLHQSAVAYEIGNPNLKAEQAYNANLSLTYSKDCFQADVGVYNNLINHYIYLKPDSVPIVRQRGAFPAYTYTQVNATFRGVDAALTYRLSKSWSVASKTSLLFAYNQTERTYLVSIPPNRTQNSLRYDWTPTRQNAHWSNVYATVNVLYVARQHRAPAVSQRAENGTIVFTGDFAPPPPAYTLVGAELGGTVTVGKTPISITLTGTNLLNQAYRDYLNRFRYFADEAGRNVMLRLKVPLTFSK